MFELPRFRSAVIVPEVVTGELPIVRDPELETPTDVTVPAFPPTHTPLIAKHPPVKVRPLANVEVAEVEVTLRAAVCIPPPKVDVPAPETIKFVVVAVPVTARLVEVAFVNSPLTAVRRDE